MSPVTSVKDFTANQCKRRCPRGIKIALRDATNIHDVPEDYWDFLDKYGLMEINKKNGKPRFSKKGRAVIKSLRDCFVGDRLVAGSAA